MPFSTKDSLLTLIIAGNTLWYAYVSEMRQYAIDIIKYIEEYKSTVAGIIEIY
jgi:hypothetical protein